MAFRRISIPTTHFCRLRAFEVDFFGKLPTRASGGSATPSKKALKPPPKEMRSGTMCQPVYDFITDTDTQAAHIRGVISEFKNYLVSSCAPQIMKEASNRLEQADVQRLVILAGKRWLSHWQQQVRLASQELVFYCEGAKSTSNKDSDADAFGPVLPRYADALRRSPPVVPIATFATIRTSFEALVKVFGGCHLKAIRACIIRPGLLSTPAVDLAAHRSVLPDMLADSIFAADYVVWDVETTMQTIASRKSVPFGGVNWIVASGWRQSSSNVPEWAYFPTKSDSKRHFNLNVLKDAKVKLLVGHNIKFDLLYAWDRKELQEFFQRGGRIWDTMYAHYLLTGQKASFPSLDTIARQYGGDRKLSDISSQMKAGVCPSTMPPDELLQYLVGGGPITDGTVNSIEDGVLGDLGNTEIVFLRQVALAEERDMLPMMFARFDSLLATTAMEHAGLDVDVETAKQHQAAMAVQHGTLVEQIRSSVHAAVKEAGIQWPEIVVDSISLQSPAQLATLLFGRNSKLLTFSKGKHGPRGSIQLATAPPVTPELPTGAACPYPVIKYTIPSATGGKPEKKEFVVTSHGVLGDLTPFHKEMGDDSNTWFTPAGKLGASKKLFVHLESRLRDPDFAKKYGQRLVFLPVMLKLRGLEKDAKTYYGVVEDDVAASTDDCEGAGGNSEEAESESSSTLFGSKRGMLQSVDPNDGKIHHCLHHVTTLTGRLSSSNPNCQNIPRGDKSVVKDLFVSRFGTRPAKAGSPPTGLLLEADYSQLEIVCQAVLSYDPVLTCDLAAGVDFHSKRLALKLGIDYDKILSILKDHSHPDHAKIKQQRTLVKAFSFQRAYGAGVQSIARSTNLPEREVEKLIENEEQTYSKLSAFYFQMELAVKDNYKAVLAQGAIPLLDSGDEMTKIPLYLSPVSATEKLTSLHKQYYTEASSRHGANATAASWSEKFCPPPVDWPTNTGPLLTDDTARGFWQSPTSTFYVYEPSYRINKWGTKAPKPIPLRNSQMLAKYDVLAGEAMSRNNCVLESIGSPDANVTFYSPTIKNYCVQGLGGEIMQTMLGRLWRAFLARKDLRGKVLLVNTVHDCVWIDCEAGIIDDVARIVSEVLTDITPTFSSLHAGRLKWKPNFKTSIEVGPTMNRLEEYYLSKEKKA